MQTHDLHYNHLSQLNLNSNELLEGSIRTESHLVKLLFSIKLQSRNLIFHYRNKKSHPKKDQKIFQSTKKFIHYVH